MSGVVVVVGASGYVGSRLTARLLIDGHAVRAVGRSRKKLHRRGWAHDPQVEIVAADLLKRDSLKAAFKGATAIYYLAHSMEKGAGDFAARDLEAAQNTARAAQAAGAKQIIYLGGLGQESKDLSEHLRSRHAVGDKLRESSVPVTELRAAMIIGNGSASYEILRYLTERLPVMIAPRWVRVPVQPIGIRDALDYLVGVLHNPNALGKAFDIGGPKATNYQELFETYARLARLRKRVILPVPVLSPRLSSYWIHLVTPIGSSIARPLAEGLRNPVVCAENEIAKIVPGKRMDHEDAIRAAVEAAEFAFRHPRRAETLPEAPHIGDAPWAGGTVFRDERAVGLPFDAVAAWKAVERLGGPRGWSGARPLWWTRAVIDQLMGGPGLGGKARAKGLDEGNHEDDWHVIEVEKGRHARFESKMKLPGTGDLAFRIEATPDGSQIEQRARFRPRGLAGIVYWGALYPAHAFVFHRLIKAIRREAAHAPQAQRAKPA